MERQVQTVFTATGQLEKPTIPITLKPKRCGRPSLCLTTDELQEALSYYISTNQSVRDRLLAKYGERKLKHARAIHTLDYGTQGRIFRHTCSFHGRQYLKYNWCGQEDGIRIRCYAPGGCTFNTHHNGYLFKGEDKYPDE
jgi:hypothetical protein